MSKYTSLAGASLGGGSSTVINNVSNYYTEVNEATGFVDPADSTLSFNNDNRTFTIAPTVESFVFYAFGTRYEKTQSESIIIDDINGLWYFSYNAEGTLVASQSIWDLSTQVPVASVYWDGAAGVIDEPAPPTVKPSKSSDLYVISISVLGKPSAAQVVLFHVVVGGETIELKKRLPYSYIKCNIAPTAEAVFDIQVNGVSKGSATIAAGQTAGSFTWNTKIEVGDGDIIKITAPEGADDTLSDIGLTLRGYRL